MWQVRGDLQPALNLFRVFVQCTEVSSHILNTNTAVSATTNTNILHFQSAFSLERREKAGVFGFCNNTGLKLKLKNQDFREVRD